MRVTDIPAQHLILGMIGPEENAPLLRMRTWMDHGKRRSIIPSARRLEFHTSILMLQRAFELQDSGINATLLTTHRREAS